MTKEEIYKEMQMPYADLCAYLIQKYGGAVVDYFPTPECKSKNKKVSRTSEGLECHHMDEDKGVLLSSSLFAKDQPFDWQKKERLVYCNMLEHLILHMKIFVLATGVFLLCSDINDMFMKDGTTVAWRRRCFEEIRDNYNDYIILLKTILLHVDNSYLGKKDDPPFLSPGSVFQNYSGDCEIIKLTNNKEEMLVKTPHGEKTVRTSTVYRHFTYFDHVDFMTRKLSRGYDMFYTQIFEDINKPNDERLISEFTKALSIDDEYDWHSFPWAVTAQSENQPLQVTTTNT